MGSRATITDRATLQKRMYDFYAVVAVAAAGAVTLQKWNYPVFGTGPNARTYTAAPVAAAGVATGYPQKYQAGSEGIFSVARTGAGLWTVTLQDNYQRLLELTGFSRLAGGLSAVVSYQENTTITNMTAANGSVIGVALLSATATPLDPANGEVVVLHFGLQDATEP